MPFRISTVLCVLAIVSLTVNAGAAEPDAARDILVTFENTGARATTAGAPYKNRKRYAISRQARHEASAVAGEYGLQQIDHWPIRSLSIYCFVYRIADGDDRARVVERLRADARVESVQVLNAFETGAAATPYDDTYAELQHGLDTLALAQAHEHSLGRGIRIGVIDSGVDTEHEDLRGRLRKIRDFASRNATPDRVHGTAVTSVIAAETNNARGIVGVAPEASVELYVACWANPGRDSAVCDSFTLAKAIDSLLQNPPHVLNLSLTGPQDALLQRLLLRAFERGVIMIAAGEPDRRRGRPFPASMDEVIDVGTSRTNGEPAATSILAPGEQILVAAPDNAYDFQSGSSLAAAHVSGVVALLLSVSPDSRFSAVRSLLAQSQVQHDSRTVSINACRVLQLADPEVRCET